MSSYYCESECILIRDIHIALLSVRLSVHLRYYIETVTHIAKLLSPSGWYDHHSSFGPKRRCQIPRVTRLGGDAEYRWGRKIAFFLGPATPLSYLRNGTR